MKSVEQLIADLPQFDRKVNEKEKNEYGDTVASYKCYCCYDRGEIAPHLAMYIIPDHKLSDIVACSRTRECNRSWVNMAENVNNDIPSDVCEKLHLINLNQWKAFTQFQQKKHSEVIETFATTY